MYLLYRIFCSFDTQLYLHYSIAVRIFLTENDCECNYFILHTACLLQKTCPWRETWLELLLQQQQQQQQQQGTNKNRDPVPTLSFFLSLQIVKTKTGAPPVVLDPPPTTTTPPTTTSCIIVYICVYLLIFVYILMYICLYVLIFVYILMYICLYLSIFVYILM